MSNAGGNVEAVFFDGQIGKVLSISGTSTEENLHIISHMLESGNLINLTEYEMIERFILGK